VISTEQTDRYPMGTLLLAVNSGINFICLAVAALGQLLVREPDGLCVARGDSLDLM